MKKITAIAMLVFFISCSEKQEEPPIVQVAQKDLKQVSFSTPIDTNYTKEDVAFLKEMGLSASYTVRNNSGVLSSEVANKYKEKFNVRFVTDEVIGLLMEEKDLIMGYLINFNGVIPKNNVDEFRNNLARIRTIDSSFEEYYFIRTDLDHNARFLQRISEDEILFNNVIKSPNLNQGQETGNTLKIEREIFYSNKHGIPRDQIVIGCYTPYMQIVAPKEMFNLEGKTLLGRQIVETPKNDPLILLRVQEGWLVLTSWD